MRIEILGCNGSVMQGYNTTSLLINSNILVDAGSAASVMNEGSCRAIRHIFLTHTHMDHIKELPFLLEPLFSDDPEPINLWGSVKTIEAISEHIFNGQIWPDMQRIIQDKTKLNFCAMALGEPVELDGVTITSLPTDHIPGSVSYIISEADQTVIISGDTGYQDAVFEQAAKLGAALNALFIEVSFPNHMDAVAVSSKHLTPAMLARGLEHGLDANCRVVAYHLKPQYMDQIVCELPPGVEYIKGGEVFNF